jgi:hypothetical protein
MSADVAIGDAIVAAIQGIGLVVTAADPPAVPADVTLPDANVLRMKYPALPPKTQPPRVAVVVADRPSRVEKLTATQKLSYWPCAAVVITAGGRKHEDEERSRTWRALIEAEVLDRQRATFAGVTGFNESNAGDKLPFEPGALDKDLVFLASAFEVQVIETLATP